MSVVGRRWLALVAIVVFGVSAAGCSPRTGGPSAGPEGSAAPTMPVLGTENFYADLLQRVGASHVKASSLLNDPNADPHAFEASPQAAALVADARLVIVNGIGYDDFMAKLLDASPKPDRVVINVQKLLGLADDVNTHIWYDPATMPTVADAASAALAKLDPQNAGDYTAGKDAYLASLKPLNDRIALIKAKYAGAPVAFTEPVAGYLVHAMGLEVKTPERFMKAIEEGTDPAPADVAAERDLLTGKKVKALLYNSQVTSPITQQIRDLAVQNGIAVVGAAETIPPEFHGFAEWQLAQLDQLEKALAGGR